MSKNDNIFDMNDYYDAEYIDEFEGYDEAEEYPEEELDDNPSENYEEMDDFADDLYGDDSYQSFQSQTSGRKRGEKKAPKAPVKGTEVHQRFFQIMEDYHSGDIKKKQYAQECAIEELKGFIYHIIKKSYSTYAKNNFYDLIQEGKLGIMEGMKKYDPNKSMPTTFFSPYIKHEIQGHITKQVDKTTAHYSSSIKKINRAIEGFESTGKPYTNVDIAIQTQLSLETVNQSMAIKNYRDEIHIDACVPGMIDNNTTSQRMPTPEEEYFKREETEVLYRAIAETLTPQEIQVCQYHFGLNDTETLSEGEISKRMGIPKDKVKKLINSSIRKLKDSELKNLYRNHLAEEDKLIKETKLSTMPTLTLDAQLDILEGLTDDDV